MLLKLSSSTCSLCDETDVSLSEGDTVQYVRFIKDKLGKDIKLVNGKQFRMCLLCSHSLDLLREVVTRTESCSVKYCFCCNSTDNLFKQNDLPSSYKTNINSFASVFNLQGRNICIHCFYAINFWVKLSSFLKSTEQMPDRSKRNSISHSPTKSNNHRKKASPTAASSKFNNGTFQMPRNVHTIPEIKQQAKTIKLLQGKMNRTLVRKFSHDKKLIESVPFVFLSRIQQCNDEVLIISDDTDVEPLNRSSRSKAKGKTTRMKKRNSPAKRSFREDTPASEDSDTSSPVWKFKSRPLKVVISPLKHKQLPSPIKKKNATLTSNKKRSRKNKNEFTESDDNDYSVTSSGSSTGIVIKRIARSNKYKSAKSQKLVASTLRTIRIQTKKTNTSSSSDNTDVSVVASTPRSPATLPPKKRKRNMDYFDSTPIPEKRPTRSPKSKKRIEEVIIDNSSEDADQYSTKNRRQTRNRGSKRNALARIEADGEKDPLEIFSSSEEEEIHPEDSINLSEHADSTPDETGPRSVKPRFKRVLAAQTDSSEDPQEINGTATATPETITKLIAKYVDSNDTTQNLTKDTEESNSELANTQASREEQRPLEEAAINFERSLTSPPESRVADTLDLLACINDENTNQTKSKKSDELNLPDVEKTTPVEDTESTLLISHEEGLFNLDTQRVSFPEGDAAEGITRSSSQSSNYQDAVETEQSSKVTVLQDNAILTEDESDDCIKRKRNVDDSMDSTDAADTDELPRKRVRFAVEKKVLDQDDTVYLENVDGSEEQVRATAGETQENEAEINDSETLCTLDDI